MNCSKCGNLLDDEGHCGECSESENSTLDFQVGGTHYKSKKIQPIEYILANEFKFPEGNIIKYISRHDEKNGAEDVLKSIQYHLFILKDTYGEEYEIIKKENP